MINMKILSTKFNDVSFLSGWENERGKNGDKMIEGTIHTTARILELLTLWVDKKKTISFTLL